MNEPRDIAAAIPKFQVDLGPSEDGSSFAVYQANSAPHCAISLLDGSAASDFWIRSTVFQLPHAMICGASAAAQMMRRGSEQLEQGGTQIFMMAQIEGEVNGTAAGRRVSFGPGDVVFYDYARDYESVTTDFRMAAVLAAREGLSPLFSASEAHGAVLRAGTGATPLIHGSLCTLLECADDMTIAEADAAVDALYAMAAGALRTTLGLSRSYSFEDAQVEKAVNFIEAKLADASLGPASIALHLGVSRSALYRLLEPSGGVGALILKLRLDRSLKVLATASNAAVSISRLAGEHGFNNTEHFSRAFRRRFGITPRAFHQIVARRDHAALTEQAQRAGFISWSAWLDHIFDPNAGA